jgi:ATP-dependent RNA helicase RhlE
MTFSELDLISPLKQALTTSGYTVPTPIQQQSIPPLLAGKDIFGCAQTGTGKTAAFALPILQLMQQKHKPGQPAMIKALILAPTRELANQIDESFGTYGANLPFKHAVLFGGVSAYAQVQKLKRGVDILVATPGRLLDLVNQGHVNLKHVEYFVLDEADRMLDMGFINDIRKLLKILPANRQTMFFSATMPDVIMKLAGSMLKNPVRVSVTPVSSASVQVKQSVYYVNKKDKRSLLTHVLKKHAIQHALVFTRTKRGADRLVKELKNVGVRSEAIHGNKSQNAREFALKQFKERNIHILVATDIASRGIDIDKLSHVINYELPEHSENYVHRIGRTGRAGESGIALSFCSEEEKSYLKDIQKLIKKNMEVVDQHPFVKSTSVSFN